MESSKMTEQENKNTITIDEITYSVDDMTDEQKAILSVVEVNAITARNLNQQAIQINHQLNCVNSIGEVKRRELKESLINSEETAKEAVAEDTVDAA